MVFQGLFDLIVNAVTLNTATAKSNQYFFIFRNQCFQFGDFTFAENKLRGVLKNEIKHLKTSKQKFP